MTLRELKSLLAESKGRQLLMRLPDSRQVPVSFHITEVGQVHKVFMDCGGKVRSRLSAVLQAWVGSDEHHRLTIDKFLGILEKTESIIPQDDIPLEVEYEDSVISQYPVSGCDSTADSLIMNLGLKHTDCLAKEVCIKDGCGDNSGCCSEPTEAAVINFR